MLNGFSKLIAIILDNETDINEQDIADGLWLASRLFETSIPGLVKSESTVEKQPGMKPTLVTEPIEDVKSLDDSNKPPKKSCKYKENQQNKFACSWGE